MKYCVTYTELLARTVIVDADSEKEAKEKVLDAVNNEAIILTADDYVMDSGEIADCCKSDSYDLEYYPTLESFTD
jgi:hypothetical protein